MSKFWDDYRKARGTVHMSLSELGLPNEWVEFRSPGAMCMAEWDDLSKKSEKAENSILSVNELMMIAGWSLTKQDADEPLPLPSIDPSVAGLLPLELQLWIREQLNELIQQQITAPKGWRRNSDTSVAVTPSSK